MDRRVSGDGEAPLCGVCRALRSDCHMKDKDKEAEHPPPQDGMKGAEAQTTFSN